MVDKFNEWYVSAFVSASRIRFLMLHTQRCDEGIRQFFQVSFLKLTQYCLFWLISTYFFQEMYETYIKYAMNPFYEINTPIKSAAFEQKAVIYGRKYLV